MSTNDIPPYVLVALDQAHAKADMALDALLERFIGEGVADLDMTAQRLGVHTALRCLPQGHLTDITTAALCRLLNPNPEGGPNA
jgi:hypothetical protein